MIEWSIAIGEYGESIGPKITPHKIRLITC